MELPAQGDRLLVVYYFFTGLRSDSLSPITLMRSILHQILSPEILSPTLQRAIENRFSDLTGPCEPDRSELESLIMDQWGKLKVKETFLILDGLDEADARDRKQVLSFLLQLYKLHSTTLKILTSAQPEVDLGSPFRNETTITTLYLQGQDMQTDVDIYLQTQGTTYLTDGLLGCSEALISEVKQILSCKSEGMYVTQQPLTQ